MIAGFSFLIFLIIIRCSAKDSKDFWLCLVLFSVSCVAKVFFLLLWALHKTGEIDLNYLQFVDEFYYINYEWGDPIAVFGDAYCVIVYVLQRIGFSYFDLKVLNILSTSFALVRLYSLHELVADKRKYYSLLLIVGGLLHIHIIYYSIFVLKDAMVFVFFIELFVQLFRRQKHKVPWRIIINILALTQLRSTLRFLFGIFVFDRNWKLSKKRLVVLGCILVFFSAICFEYLEHLFMGRVRGGLYYQMNMVGREVPTLDEVRFVVYRNPALLIQIAKVSLMRVLSPFHQEDIIDVGVSLMYYFVVFYLLFIEKNRTPIRTIWPILFFPAMFLVINMLAYVNMRWALYPFGTFLYSLIFLACRPAAVNLPRPMVSSRHVDIPVLRSLRLRRLDNKHC